jgi:colicin import membrane protein
MSKRSPLLIDRGRNGLLALVIAVSFAVHLGLIWLMAEGGVSIRPHVPLVIEVALVGGDALASAAQPAAEVEVKKRKASRKPGSAQASAKKREAADVILPGKPTATPSPVPTPTPTPTPRAIATPRPSPKPTAVKKKAKPVPTAMVKPKETAVKKKTAAVAAPVAKRKPAAEKEESAAKKPATGEKTNEPTVSSRSLPKVKEAATKSAAAPGAAARVAEMAAALNRVRQGRAGSGAGTGADSGGGVGHGSGGTAMDPEFAAYYGLMLERIRDAWFWPGRRPNLKVTVGFRVGVQGRLTGIRVVQDSGDRSYDGSVLRALRAVNPLPPPPTAYRRDFADVELIFHPADLEGVR